MAGIIALSVIAVIQSVIIIGIKLFFNKREGI